MSVTVTLAESVIDTIIQDAKSSVDVVIELHKVVIPGWDRVVDINQHVRVSEHTNERILHKMLNSPNLQEQRESIGGIWINYGFGTDEDVWDWAASYEPDKIIYHMECEPGLDEEIPVNHITKHDILYNTEHTIKKRYMIEELSHDEIVEIADETNRMLHDRYWNIFSVILNDRLNDKMQKEV